MKARLFWQIVFLLYWIAQMVSCAYDDVAASRRGECVHCVDRKQIEEALK